MRAALVQLCAGDDPAANLKITLDRVEEAAREGVDFVTTPEVTNCVCLDRDRQRVILSTEAEDPTLRALRDTAARLGLWLHIGSLALKSDVGERFVNRAFLIDPTGGIRARYDKIHMFDVAVSPTETYRESDAFVPGDRAVVFQTPLGAMGMTICYDLRFPQLYHDLAKAGAQILLVPSAFSPATGPSHWRTLLQARAIETGCFVLAAAQTGTHPAQAGRKRTTYGHSLAVSPWGEVIADAGLSPGVTYVDLDLAEVAATRRKLPSLKHDRDYQGP